MVLPSLEVAGAGGHWVEVSRAICPGEPSDETKQMMEGYEEYYAAAKDALKDGATAHDVHRAVAKGFVDRGFKLGHVTGHSIGMTMIEFPKIGEGDETELRDGHGLLDAPARDLAGRPRLPLHAGHLARDSRRRGPARGPADEDLQRDGGTCMTELAKPILPGEGGSDYERYLRTDDLLGAAEDARASGRTATSCSSRRCTRLRALAEARLERGRGGGRGWSGQTTSRRRYRLLRRASDCMKLVTAALDMLEHMSPWEYPRCARCSATAAASTRRGSARCGSVARRSARRSDAARGRAGRRSSRCTPRAASIEELYRSPSS